MAKDSLDLCRGEGREANSLRSNRPPFFFLPATKIQGAIKGGNVNGHTGGELRWAPGLVECERWFQSYNGVAHGQKIVCFTCALDGALNFCCREEKGRETV
ncbi:hypothetical protein LMG7141_00702 [Ralstonia condita]|uniref:Uncharacterized protein n=1 Tax=Ralstonia condita TaxID=3058600 RepID=A0ABM9J038_9RALS|nr:hypothetical protein LMG7141_00702 [Ralstonia sp. LMG 7141]